MTVQRYDTLGRGYARSRRADPRIAAQIVEALGDAATVLNVGAGAGSYEPADREVVALEPSRTMMAQRTSTAPVVRGLAERLPFGDGAFDATLAVLTMHHWGDWGLGLRELRRVAQRRAVVLTWDPGAGAASWLFDYFPAILARDRARFPPVEEVRSVLDGRAAAVPVPADCEDGFLGAFWRRPERYLDADVRAGMSGFALLTTEEVAAGLDRLASDLEDGGWVRRYGELLDRDSVDLGYRLLVADLDEARG